MAEQWIFPSERALIDAVSTHRRLLHFDGAGFGLSGEISDSFDHIRLVGDCLAVADAAGLDRFAFFSESGASLMAVRLAALYPDRVSKLILVGGYVDGRARRGPAPPPDPIRGLIEEGWNTSGSGLALAYQLSYFPEGPLDLLQALARREQSTASEAMMLALRDAGLIACDQTRVALIRAAGIGMVQGGPLPQVAWVQASTSALMARAASGGWLRSR